MLSCLSLESVEVLPWQQLNQRNGTVLWHLQCNSSHCHKGESLYNSELMKLEELLKRFYQSDITSLSRWTNDMLAR